jgi:hypothetical protein
MTVLTAVLIGLAMGAAFGWALEKSRVFEPGVIVGQMQLRNSLMLKIFLTAVATGLIVLAALNGFGAVKLAPKATWYAADMMGGLVLGAGIALAGACPGTVFAQIGAGYRDAYATLLGGIAGAVAFSYAEPALRPLLQEGPGRITLDRLIGVPFWALALVFAGALVAAIVALERWRPWRSEVGANFDGVIEDAARGSMAPPPRAGIAAAG